MRVKGATNRLRILSNGESPPRSWSDWVADLIIGEVFLRGSGAMEFQYLMDKIKCAPFEGEPFRHIYVREFFNEPHFRQIISAQEIALRPAKDDEQLFAALFEGGYKVINFPGCITEREVYLKWHRRKDPRENYTNSSCEGFGMTLRLTKPASSIISDLVAFMNTSEFQQVLADKFDLQLGAVYYDNGVQKYLDGYEISPHADTRNKALTYMVNINPAAQWETKNHHTHYLIFRDEYKYVPAYWAGHPKEDRCWVPWSWCQTIKMQKENNSVVIFSPRNDTMHAVKASYDHCSGQRTQMYGNLWYREPQAEPGPEWENFVVHLPAPKMTLADRVKSAIPIGIKGALKPRKVEDGHVIANRLR
jgi:hypothetical protein